MSLVLETCIFTVAVALAATLCVLPPGIALGWLLARRQWPGKALVETLVVLPLVLPPVATGLVLLKLLGPRGWIGGPLWRWFGVEVAFTWKAVVVAAAVMAFPLVVRAARVAIEGVDPRLEGVARTLGAGRWRVFRTITLPLARRGLLAAGLLAFARALGEFGATMMVAGYFVGGTATLALGIYHRVQLGQDDEALLLAGISALLALGAVFAGEWLVRRGGERR